MKRSVCPYLGTLDSEDRPSPAVEYPSLENQCFAVSPDELLLLGDQASYCLSGGHRLCPRFQSAQRSADAVDFEAASEQPLARGALEEEPAGVGTLLGNLAEVLREERTSSRQRWAWASAALLFLVVILCGGIVASYTGWQLVRARYLEAAPAGQIDTLSDSPTTSEPLYLVVTATSPAQTPAAPAAVVAVAPSPGSAAPAAFPQAVTPTPVLVDPNALAQSANGQPLTNTAANSAPVASDQNGLLQAPPDVNLPTPAIDLQVEVPTRRPTPLFDIPTSTPEQPTSAAPTSTPSPTPVLGPPVVQFAPLQYALREGECTLVRWHVENVQAVYFENQGVNGDGEKEVCLGDEPQTFKLAVILPDGNTNVFSTTVDYLPPTPTPTPTPSFTPINENPPTPTWTPDVPTATSTPATFFNVTLEVFGESQHGCTPGSTCQFSFLATNLGNAPDSLVIAFVQSGPWPALLCDEGGNCSTANLALSNIAPNTSKLVNLRIELPSDATGQTASYGLQAISTGSGGTVTSSAKSIEVEVE